MKTQFPLNLVLIVLIGLTACVSVDVEKYRGTAQPSHCHGTHFLSISYDGKVSSGSKTELISAINQGIPIYVGWFIDTNSDEVPEIAHWHAARFLSIFEGEVFTQTPQIQAQRPKAREATIEFRKPHQT